MRRSTRAVIFAVLAGVAPLCRAQKVELAAVVAKAPMRVVELPGEFQAFLVVNVRAKVRGYVEQVLVDRGSFVKQGQLLAELSAPEMTSQIAEAESKQQASQSDRLQAEAQLAAAQSTATRLEKAAATPGAIAGNELILAQRQVEAAKALVQSRQQASDAAESAVRALKELKSYLRVTAPFDGVVTDRLVHPGALAGPGADPVLFVLQQISRLRLIVAVPEEFAGVVVPGVRVSFRVPASPDREYAGMIARSSHTLDPKTRTMAVELDVSNPDGSLSPGMYPSVKWPVRRAKQALYVPKTSVVTTTERTFVVRNRNGTAEWVSVAKGAADGDLVEVTGSLAPGDQVVRRATDEMREGSPLQSPRKVHQ